MFSNDEMAAAIGTTARDVRRLLGMAEDMKTMRSNVELARKMRPTFGPRTPGNDGVTDATLLVEIRLREWCRHLRNDLEPGRPLGSDAAVWCRWVESMAGDIAGHEEAVPFWMALSEMRRRLSAVVDGPAAEQRRERRVSVNTAARRMQVTPDTMRHWIRRGNVSAKRDDRGELFVLMSEVRQFVEEKQL